MRLLRAAAELEPAGRPVCLAIGFFDGVHLGHQEVIRQTLTQARPIGALTLVVTFDRHPNSVVCPERVPPLIYSLPQKLRHIAAAGVDAALVIAFDQPFSQQPGERFIRGLARDLATVRSICVGAAFTFGHHRDGNLALLSSLGAELRFGVQGLEAVSLEGSPVSSTRIREAVAAGELAVAERMLGRPYALCGPVVAGDRLGRQLGFPTANLDPAGLILPPNGVYAARAAIDGASLPAVLNIGRRPTLRQAEPELRVETHLIGFAGDLYGREIELVPAKRLRDEQRFSSLDELRQQIAADVAAARAVVGQTSGLPVSGAAAAVGQGLVANAQTGWQRKP